MILVVGTLGLLLMGPSQGFTSSLFLDLWVTDLGLSRSTLSLIYGAASLGAAFLLPNRVTGGFDVKAIAPWA